MDFRPRIKKLCQLKGITQKDLALKIGITDVSLNKSLRGDYPQLQTLERIAHTLNVPISDLFDESSQKASITCPNCGTELNLNVEVK